MKLETSAGQRAVFKHIVEDLNAKAVGEPPSQMTMRLLRDIDTLLAEVERLKTALSALPLPEEVEETIEALRSRYYETPSLRELVLIEETTIRTMERAASLLSRWPGVWRPIETAPKDELFLASNGKTVVFASKEPTHEQMCRDQYGYPYVATHWSPLPEPPHE